MKNKKILFLVISMNKGGAERVISILLKHFSLNKNLKVHLIMLEGTISYDIPPNVKPIILFDKKKTSIQKLLELPIIAFKIARFAKKNKIDTIVSFLYRPNYINIMTKFFGFKGNTVINIRSTTSRYLNEGFLGKINLILIRSLFNKSDLIISNSKGVKNDLNKLVNITTKHISIPNPIEIDKIKKLIKEQGLKDIDENIDYIVSVGRLIPLKRNKDLILAFSKIHQKLPNTKLLFLGEGVLKEELIKQSQDLGINNKVIFLGNVENPFYYLSKSKLFVMTSETEGFPNVLIEAMACGLAIISSNCKSGPAEILEDNKYGLLFDVGDVQDLSKKILKVLNDNKLLYKLERSALQRVVYYDSTKIINKFNKELLL